MVDALMRQFALHGYRRVKPPLLEFEDSLLSGPGVPMAELTFRLMDPETHRMMGLRADITPQIARIATTRLSHAPRPLRMSYAGQCVRVRGAALEPDRQVAQAGIELIGDDSPASDAEMVLVAAAALAAVGLTRLSFDLTMPPLVAALLDAAGGERRPALARALDRKDAAAVAAIAPPLETLLRAAGDADAALAALAAFDLPAAARPLAARLAETARTIRTRAPGLTLTVDPVEARGFSYHTGVCATVYAPGRPEELGRGGRYLCGEDEAATGLTLYPDAILRALPADAPAPLVLLPLDAPIALGQSLRDAGWSTLQALDHTDPHTAAHRLGCSHVIRDGQPVPTGL